MPVSAAFLTDAGLIPATVDGTRTENSIGSYGVG